jgi:hypothetical protein
MIAHQAIGVHLPARLLAGFGEGPQETPAILVIRENRLASIAAIHDMVDGPRILYTQLAGHGASYQKPASFVNLVV